MNCNTGEFTNDAMRVQEWLDAGDRVLYLDEITPPEPSMSRQLLDELGVEFCDASAREKERARARTLAFVQQVNRSR